MRKICLIVLLFGLNSMPARGDIATGLAAYDGGDYVQALAEWHPLAKAGDPDAQTALAGLYFQGLGVQRNPTAAADWYHKAACQGAAIAQLNLGDQYARGEGVRQNFTVALAWLNLAAQSGHTWAARRRDEIAQGLSNRRRNYGPSSIMTLCNEN
ncbi:MAG: sel1 repeat family protein [Rhodospirillaceae bacterium]|jgi:hypothetical protein|nr:sel1 repeat family protein [Rhodospirillaceae bacterium]